MLQGSGTYKKEPWTWTIVRELIMEVGGGLGGEEQRGENWDNYDSINNQIYFKKKFKVTSTGVSKSRFIIVSMEKDN